MDIQFQQWMEQSLFVEGLIQQSPKKPVVRPMFKISKVSLLGDQSLGAAKNINHGEKMLLALRLRINMSQGITPIFDSYTYPLREICDEMLALVLEFKHEVWQRIRKGC